jgi:hypothetical protein
MILPVTSIASGAGADCDLGAVGGWERFWCGRALKAVRLTLLYVFFPAEAQGLGCCHQIPLHRKKNKAPPISEQRRGVLRNEEEEVVEGEEREELPAWARLRLVG